MALLFGNVVFEAHNDGSVTCIVGGSNYPLTKDNMLELKHWLQSLSIRSHMQPPSPGGDVAQALQGLHDLHIAPYPQRNPVDFGEVQG